MEYKLNLKPMCVDNWYSISHVIVERLFDTSNKMELKRLKDMIYLFETPEEQADKNNRYVVHKDIIPSLDKDDAYTKIRTIKTQNLLIFNHNVYTTLHTFKYTRMCNSMIMYSPEVLYSFKSLDNLKFNYSMLLNALGSHCYNVSICDKSFLDLSQLNETNLITIINNTNNLSINQLIDLYNQSENEHFKTNVVQSLGRIIVKYNYIDDNILNTIVNMSCSIQVYTWGDLIMNYLINDEIDEKIYELSINEFPNNLLATKNTKMLELLNIIITTVFTDELDLNRIVEWLMNRNDFMELPIVYTRLFDKFIDKGVQFGI